MKRWLVLPFAVVALAGCASRYDITTTTGGKITNVTKPVLDPATGKYTYKDVRGGIHYISPIRVREIAVR
jgi:hypothetical protein